MRGHSFPLRTASLRAAVAGGAALLLLAGCAGRPRVPYPTAKHVELAERNGEVTTLDALKVGRSLYISRCGDCHALKDPASLDPADWPEMVGRMVDNAKINPDQQRAITQYLVGVSAALHEDDSGSAPSADSTHVPHS